MWLAGDVMLEVDVIWLRLLLGQEGGCVASRGCDAGGIGVIWLRWLLEQEGGCVASRGCDAGGRCQMAKTIVGAGGRMCG